MTKVIELNKEIRLTGEDPTERFALDVLMGLTSSPKTLSPKYLYDKRGSELFQDITDLDEYYPTACEFEVLKTHSKEMMNLPLLQQSKNPINIIELGAGDGRKTRVFIEALRDSEIPFTYIPVDISKDALESLVATFKGDYPEMKMEGVVGEYFDALKWLRNAKEGKTFVLFLGSNIGNFSGPQSRVFLKTLWNSLRSGDQILTGFDIKKDIDVMLRAYNDSAGVTRNFNLNLLERMNRELGANFDLSKFQHFGTYNTTLGAMESFIISKVNQKIYIGELNRYFELKAFEPIHVEFSFKFLPEDIDYLAEQTGFEVARKFYDSKKYFCNAVFEVNKKQL